MPYTRFQFIFNNGWPAWTLVLIASSCALCLALPRRNIVRVVSVLSVSAAGTWLYVTYWPTPRSPMQHIAWLGAALSLLWSACAAATLWRDRRHAAPVPYRARFVPVAHAAALLFAVVVVVVQSVVLTMRLTFVTVDLAHGFPWSGYREYGFGSDGLWSLAMLFLSCAVSIFSTRDTRLVTCQVWLGVMLVLWSSMLQAPLARAATGGFERTGATMLLLVGLSAIVFATAVILRGRDAWRQSGSAFRIGMIVASIMKRRTRPLLNQGKPAPTVPSIPGVDLSVRILGVAVALLVCYHLLVPVKLPVGGSYGPGMVAAASAALVAWAGVLLAGTIRGRVSYDVTVGLGSLALCGLATLALPSPPGPLDARYPMVFNVLIVGLTTACAICLWAANRFGQHLAPNSSAEGSLWFLPAVKRFAFLNAAMAIQIALIMAIWPRLPTIATMDDSLGRVLAGLGANLALLCVVLACAVRQRRPAFHILTVMAMFTTGAFLWIRMLPYGSSTG